MLEIYSLFCTNLYIAQGIKKLMKILVTGGCGFIGSNFIKLLLDREIGQVVNIDSMTYAGQGRNLENMGLADNKNHRFYWEDISNPEVANIISHEKPDIIYNFAAESHVDRSLIEKEKEIFEKANIAGARNLLDCALERKIKFIQISTDEVYGSIKEGSFYETSELNPQNPYSETKFKAERLAKSYHKHFNLPAIITRSSNNYGPYQYPEKLIPLFITNLIDGKKVPLMWSEENPGLNVRDWIHVEDNCKAILYASQLGKSGEIYNIPGENEVSNIQITKSLLDIFGYGEDMIEHIPHRKSHDFRYSINGDKIKSLGFHYHNNDFQKGLEDTVRWYYDNQPWWRQLKQ